jgi:U2 small nuclear ribonucleoprotein B''
LFISVVFDYCYYIIIRFPGFKEVRLVPTKKGLAFVEFETEMQATVAMTGLNNFRVDDTHAMVISYAKRG